MTRTVIVGLDGSHESLAAARWGGHEAQRRGVPLRLVHVRVPQSAHPALHPHPGHDRHWAEQIAQEAETDLSELYPELEITADDITGRPATVLAEKAGAGLLVLGSRGLVGLIGFVVGSVALATVAHAEGPVVLVRAEVSGPDPEGPQDVPASTPAEGPVVLGLDLNHPYEELFGFAFDTAARQGVPLHVVHGWDPPLVYGVNTIDAGLADDLIGSKIQALADALRPWRQKFPGTEVVERAVVGQPARHLVKASEEASLMVVGRHVRRLPLGPRIGTVTHALMHHSVAPVAVVPHT